MSDSVKRDRSDLTTKGAVENAPSEASGGDRPVGTLPVAPECYPILDRLMIVKGELDARKALFDEYNELVMKLVALGFVELPLGSVGVVRLVDNLKDNKIWKTACAARFDVEVLSRELLAKRAKRAAKAGCDE